MLTLAAAAARPTDPRTCPPALVALMQFCLFAAGHLDAPALAPRLVGCYMRRCCAAGCGQALEPAQPAACCQTCSDKLPAPMAPSAAVLSQLAQQRGSNGADRNVRPKIA